MLLCVIRLMICMESCRWEMVFEYLSGFGSGLVGINPDWVGRALAARSADKSPVGTGEGHGSQTYAVFTRVF